MAPINSNTLAKDDEVSNSSLKDKINSTFKRAAQEIYKKNFELSVKNKTSSVIKSLYAITMGSLDISEVSQKIVDTIVGELHFTAAIISLVDNKSGLLKPFAITKNPQIDEALRLIAKPLEEISIPLDFNSNLAINVINNKKMGITGNLFDILTPHVDQELADKIQNLVRIKTLMVYPIVVGDEILGVFNVAISKDEKDMSMTERQSLEQIIDIVGIALDRAKLHEELKLTNIKLKELDKQKDEFINMAAHELRAPMTAIKGYISMTLEGDVGELPQGAKDYLSDAMSVTDRLVRLVNNMLDVSRIEEGRMVYNTGVVELKEVVNQVHASFKFEAERKGLQFLIEIPEGIKDTVKVDQDRIHEVAGNFVSNAVKYTEAGSIKIKLSNPTEGRVKLEVIDTGPGISKKEQSKLFQKFFRVESTAGKTIGTGLGLYISKLLVGKFGGEMGLDSDAGKGSDFWFELPVSNEAIGDKKA